MKYWSHPPFRNESEAVGYLEEARRSFENRSLFQWGLCLRNDDSLRGTCTLWQIDEQNRRAEVGFALARADWGKGLMTAGLTVLIGYCFERLRLRRLEADVDPENETSIALLERLGFRREGRLRERWLVGGKVFDSLFYGLLERDWREGHRPTPRPGSRLV